MSDEQDPQGEPIPFEKPDLFLKGDGLMPIITGHHPEYQPIPFEKHYQVFSEVERRIMDYLAKLGPQEYLVGLRVAYDFVDSPNEPDVFPYEIKFGNLVDDAADPNLPDNEVDEDAWKAMFGDHFPLNFIDDLYQYTQDTLNKLSYPAQVISRMEMKTGVASSTVSSQSCCCCNCKRQGKKIRTCSGTTCTCGSKCTPCQNCS